MPRLARALCAVLLLCLLLGPLVAGVVAMQTAAYGCVHLAAVTACVGDNDVMAWW